MARASKFTVSKVSTGRRRQDARVVETARARTHFREVVIPRRSEHSSSRSAVTRQSCVIDHVGAGSVDGASGGVTLRSRRRRPRRCRCGFVPGRALRKCPGPTPWHGWTAGAAASRAGRTRAPLYAIDATPHEFCQQPELRRAALRSPSHTRPLRLRVRILQPRPVVRRSERFRGSTQPHDFCS